MKNLFKNISISLLLFLVSITLLAVVYFRNASYIPLVLHFTQGEIGDFLGSRSNLLSLAIGFVSLCSLNYFISFKILKDKPELARFINLTVLILNIFFLILSYQIFYINK